MQKRIISLTIFTTVGWNIFSQESPQEKFFFAAQHGDVATVNELLKNVSLSAKNSAGLTALQLVAQQALPVEDKWMQFKYNRLQQQQIPAPTQEEQEAEKKLFAYLEIAQKMLAAGAEKKDLLLWDRKWYTGEDVNRIHSNDYPLNFAKFNVDQDETKARKQFVEEQNKLAYFFNNNVIRK